MIQPRPAIALVTSFADCGVMNERSATFAFDDGPRASSTDSAVYCASVMPSGASASVMWRRSSRSRLPMTYVSRCGARVLAASRAASVGFVERWAAGFMRRRAHGEGHGIGRYLTSGRLPPAAWHGMMRGDSVRSGSIPSDSARRPAWASTLGAGREARDARYAT
ncbi:hypothetical protein X947_5709 [Burkholderia pseudomallei MSHR7334]|nr:hypothetical protein X989_5291 [Burkholderia pseudomallei MSHR4378]KGS73845.1 hypothetical protein X947_5709 [Burkholderia pseudomallei MSHR7334]